MCYYDVFCVVPFFSVFFRVVACFSEVFRDIPRFSGIFRGVPGYSGVLGFSKYCSWLLTFMRTFIYGRLKR